MNLDRLDLGTIDNSRTAIGSGLEHRGESRCAISSPRARLSS